MDHFRLPRGVTLSAEGGVWMLCWDEHAIGLDEAWNVAPRNSARIGSAAGADALSEVEARRQARRYLLSQVPAGARAQRSQMTFAEFVETRFLPEFLSGKKFAWRGHYLSVLRHILSPEDCERMFGEGAGHSSVNLNRDPDWPFLGHLALRDIGARHVHELIRVALDSGYSHQTVRHIRSLISAVFSHAKQELVFTGANPTGSVKLPRADRKSTRGLTFEQMERALGAMRYPEKQMTLIGLLTDMNVSEICGLQWKRVNLTGSWQGSGADLIPPITIAVRKRWYRGELAEVKDTRQRDIQIPEMLLPMLLFLRARTAFSGPDDFVLTSRTGTAINVSNITARRLGPIGRELGIPELTLQALRRAHRLVNEGPGIQFRHSMSTAGTSELL